MKAVLYSFGLLMVVGLIALNSIIFKSKWDIQPIQFAEDKDSIVVGSITEQPKFQTGGIMKEVLARPLFNRTRQPFVAQAVVAVPELPELELAAIEEELVDPENEKAPEPAPVAKPAPIIVEKAIPPDVKLHGLFIGGAE